MSIRSMVAKQAWLGVAAVWLVAAAVVGCGGGEPEGKGVAFSGKVSFDGAPVEEGTITLVPQGGAEAPVTASISDGAFETTRATGPSPGKYRVEIRVLAPLSDAASAKAKARAEAAANSMMFGKSPADFGGAPESTTPPRVNVAPERYNTRSSLTAEIPAAESHVQDFALSK